MSIPPTSFQEYYANLNNLIPKGSICINGYVYSVDTKDDKVVLTSLDVTTQELMATAEVPKENGQKYHIDHMGTNEWFLLSYFEDNTRRFRLVTIKKDGSFMVGPPTEAYVVPTDGIKSRFVKTDSATAEVAWKEQSDGADSKAIIYDLSGNLPAQPAATVDFAVGEVVSTDKQVVLVGENNQEKVAVVRKEKEDIKDEKKEEEKNENVPRDPLRLHASNLPFRFRDKDLRTLCEPFGAVDEVQIIFNDRGSKGFGFVSFYNPEHADKCRIALNGMVLDKRKIEVNQATGRLKPSRKQADLSMLFNNGVRPISHSVQHPQLPSSLSSNEQMDAMAMQQAIMIQQQLQQQLQLQQAQLFLSSLPGYNQSGLSSPFIALSALQSQPAAISSLLSMSPSLSQSIHLPSTSSSPQSPSLNPSIHMNLIPPHLNPAQFLPLQQPPIMTSQLGWNLQLAQLQANLMNSLSGMPHSQDKKGATHRYNPYGPSM